MEDILYALLFGPPILGAANMLLGIIGMQRIVRRLPEIQTDRDMLAFKQFVETQMYQALFQLGLLAIPLLTAGYAFAAAGWPGQRVLLCLVPNVAVSTLGIFVKPVESRVKRMPVAEEYREEFDHVVDTWMKKALPDR